VSDEPLDGSTVVPPGPPMALLPADIGEALAKAAPNSDKLSLNEKPPRPRAKYKGKVHLDRLSVMQKFYERLRREGRYHHWGPLVRRLSAENGKSQGQNKWEAARQLGYTTAEDEHRLHQAWLDKCEADKKAEQERVIAEAAARIRAEQEQTEAAKFAANSFVAACAGLPDEAPVPIEIKWIRAHPAMSRRDRDPGDSAILVTPDDILNPPHGPAPSKSAVAQLQHWVNDPREFFKALLSEHKKITGESGTVKAEEDVDLAEVQRLLKEVSGGQS
jgi:hypothetical protein